MKMWQSIVRATNQFRREEKGITGLETAIVLIAFVVVASVFAYAVLNTGLISADKSKESINAGMKQVRSTMELKSTVVGEADALSAGVEKVKFMLATAPGGDPIDLTAGKLVVTYQDENEYITVDSAKVASAWKVGDGDILDPGEIVEVTVTLDALATLPAVNTQFTLELRPPTGAVMNISRTVPAEIKTVMSLN